MLGRPARDGQRQNRHDTARPKLEERLPARIRNSGRGQENRRQRTPLCRELKIKLLRLDAKDVNQRRESRWLLPAARIVEEESRKGLTPVFEHSHQRSAREVRLSLVFVHISEADVVDCGTDDEIQIVGY